MVLGYYNFWMHPPTLEFIQCLNDTSSDTEKSRFENCNLQNIPLILMKYAIKIKKNCENIKIKNVNILYFEPKMEKVGEKFFKSIKIVLFQNSGNCIILKIR